MSKSCKSWPSPSVKHNQDKIESLLLSFAPFSLTRTKTNALDFYVTARSRFQSCSVMSGDMSRNSVTLEFDDNLIAIYALKSSVTPTFLSRNTLYLQLSLHCPKMNKKSMCEGKKFTISVRETSNPAIMRLQGAWNANLLFEEPHQLTKFA